MANDPLNIPDDDSLDQTDTSAAASLDTISPDDASTQTASAPESTGTVVPRSGSKTIHISSS